eukprot:gnl/Chilomastix_cuspidata/10768.p1 GENE.gnl/Chilomastix_cuspidata/10768~~gnl/Chilomastix_cuspidata/10768.p1  ORF type:complete len:114 (+),score=8.47 gnl/Chilomastix_cuspidata/10768:169-510(+)
MVRQSESDHITKITKDLISSLFDESKKNSDDGTGYIKSVKAVIQGMRTYLDKNGRSAEFENVFKKIHDYSKEIWIESLTGESLEDKNLYSAESEILYYDYCFEHIFKKGEFPL